MVNSAKTLGAALVSATGLHRLLHSRFHRDGLTILMYHGVVRGATSVSDRCFLEDGMAAIPFALACAAVEHFWHPRNLFMFSLQIAALLPLVPLSLFLIFREEIQTQARQWRWRRRAPDTLRDQYEPSATTVG